MTQFKYQVKYTGINNKIRYQYAPVVSPNLMYSGKAKTQFSKAKCSMSLVDTCVQSNQIQAYITHFSRKLHIKYQQSMEVEDAKQELWYAILKALPRYRYEVKLVDFAKRAVFSHYGTMISDRGNKTKVMNARTSDLEDHNPAGVDASYAIVDAQFTLEQIERDLATRAGKSRQYQVAIELMGLMKLGMSVRESCKTLKVSHQYGSKIFNNIIRKCGDKYKNRTITMIGGEDYDKDITESNRRLNLQGAY